MAVAMGQATWSIPELTRREKALACLAADLCMRDLGLPFEMHIGMALANGVPLRDVREAILQSAIEAGHTATLAALQRFKEVCGKIGQSLPRDGQGAGDGPAFDYFADAAANGIDARLAQMWRVFMPAHWSRAGLSVKERAYISLTGNVLQSTLGAPFLHHVRLARADGSTDEQIRALFLFLSEYGFSRSWAALDALAAS
jgi:alkylhydroperoxidase/carboxymuconolactone decarboxylase family protein YurZ